MRGIAGSGFQVPGPGFPPACRTWFLGLLLWGTWWAGGPGATLGPASFRGGNWCRFIFFPFGPSGLDQRWASAPGTSGVSDPQVPAPPFEVESRRCGRRDGVF